MTIHRFDNKRFIVTGAADGLGLATTRRLVSEGARVAMVDIAGEKVAAAAEEFGDSARSWVADISKESEVQSAFDGAIEWLGGLDGLVNCAGIVDFCITHELPLERWQRMIDVVLTGTFLTNKAAIPHLLETNGAVVNVGSIGGMAGAPWQAAYASAKAGVINLTKVLASEYVSRVRFNCLVAGNMSTDIVGNSEATLPPDGITMDEFLEEYGRRVISPNRIGEPEEMAAVAAFLLSDDASYMEGSAVVVDEATTA